MFEDGKKYIKTDIVDLFKSNMKLYGDEVNTQRSIPLLYTGLKPVHTRILYSMFVDKVFSNTTYRKCAKVIGNVMGNYHP